MDLKDFIDELSNDIEIKDANGKPVYPFLKSIRKKYLIDILEETNNSIKDLHSFQHSLIPEYTQKSLARTYLCLGKDNLKVMLNGFTFDFNKQLNKFLEKKGSDINLLGYNYTIVDLFYNFSIDKNITPTKIQEKQIKDIIDHGPHFLSEVYKSTIAPTFGIKTE